MTFLSLVRLNLRMFAAPSNKSHKSHLHVCVHPTSSDTRQQRVESMILFWHPLTCQQAHRHALLLARAFKQSIPELVD